MNFLDKLERKFGKFYIRNLMLIVVSLTVAFYTIIYIFGQYELLFELILIPDLVLQGEYWRLITFVFVPENMSMIMFLLWIFFYTSAGRALEAEWGGFRLNVYFFVGVLAGIVVSFITGEPTVGFYINLSIFLAYAKLYPDATIFYGGILPLKAKWMGFFAWFIIIIQSIKALSSGNFYLVLDVMVPVINYLLFFAGYNYRNSKMRVSSAIRKREFKNNIDSVAKPYRHKCSVCGLTDLDDENMEFRYCSKCEGNHAYCEKHLKDHIHIKND